jgi:hypothetical protein
MVAKIKDRDKRLTETEAKTSFDFSAA